MKTHRCKGVLTDVPASSQINGVHNSKRAKRGWCDDVVVCAQVLLCLLSSFDHLNLQGFRARRYDDAIKCRASSEQSSFFSKLNYYYFGYFDPTNTFFGWYN